MLLCFPSHTQITSYVPKIYCPSEIVWLFESTETFVLIKTVEGPMQFCFLQSSCQSCSEEEQELHPSHPIHLTTALGHNKIRNSVVRGSGSSHNIFPDISTKSFPHSVRQITHVPCSSVPCKFKLQRCCRQMSSPGGCLVTASSHSQHLGVPRH